MNRLTFEVTPGSTCELVMAAFAKVAADAQMMVKGCKLTFAVQSHPHLAACNGLVSQMAQLLQDLFPATKGQLRIMWGRSACIKYRGSLLGKIVPSNGGVWHWVDSSVLRVLNCNQSALDELKALSGF